MRTNIKIALYKKCFEYAEERKSNAQRALDEAMEAGETETKSSLGDKHETGRAMAQLEQEKALTQLNEAEELYNTLLKTDPLQRSNRVALGSLVITDKANFYVAIAAGKIEIENDTFFAISSASPIGTKLMGLGINEEVVVNSQRYKVKKLI